MNDEILTEIKELRSDFRAFSIEVVERIAKLEVHDHDIAGNGQPGRLKEAEDKIDGLEKWKWKAIGACTVISLVLPIAVGLLMQLWK